MARVTLVLLMVLLTTAGCQSMTGPTTAGRPLRGSYTGTFQVTFHDWQNRRVPSSQSGTVSFVFGADGYSYSGSIERTTDKLEWSQIRDRGDYQVSGFVIEMSDDSNLMASPDWKASLYLLGPMKLRPTDLRGGMRISGDTPMAQYDIRLAPLATAF